MTREKAMGILEAVFIALPLPYDSEAHNAIQFALKDMKRIIKLKEVLNLCGDLYKTTP